MGKSKNKVTNWSEYNRALTQLGSIIFWVDEPAMRHRFGLNITCGMSVKLGMPEINTSI